MQELGITLTHDRGVNPVVDLFIENPEAVATSETIRRTDDGLWFVDRVTGPQSAMDALDEVYSTTDHGDRCVTAHDDCAGAWEYDVLERGPTNRTISTYATEPGACHTVLDIAASTLDSNVLFDTLRRGNRTEWRLLIQAEEELGELYEKLDDRVSSGVSLQFDRLQRPTDRSDGGVTTTGLPYEQRAALEAAVAAGYYETPRETHLSDLAAETEIPESTLRYRLRRAEAWLATEVFDASDPSERSPVNETELARTES
ncbi:helix-turn-helix domain-containing protein [Halococcus sp. IIIV-5B]|uniref:helix-turn-helix domain-containing protein n=1 Tax=Halococcus sp. IIIV-5B TaxID=2321230 RepID=UPI0013146B0D|nr:helix-turn-helix domain-containing protein [Halococcus sp. IIIV-5B]